MITHNTDLQQWLQQVYPLPGQTLTEMQGDASFRRYYRLQHENKSYVVMDASREPSSCQPFVAISRALYPRGLIVPEIIAHDLSKGYLLISDLGDRLYLNELRTDNANELYKNALNALSQLQSCMDIQDWNLPAFDQQFMQRELNEFNTWVINRYLKLTPSDHDKNILQDAFTKIISNACQQPQVFMHRDYHSANLMVLPEQKVGILDFQDACIGPLSYDLVSLLRDCYIDWPDSQVQNWVNYYHEKLREQRLFLHVSADEFMQWFDWMGIQRHLKASFIFARKFLRDFTPRYLHYIPRTFNYVAHVSAQYPELKELHHYVTQVMIPAEEALRTNLCVG